jgi:type I restriction enzyme S subunit
MYKLVKLSTIANISTGFPFKGEKYSNQGIRVVRGENVTVGSLRWDSIKCWNQRFEQSEKYSLKDGDVVIGMDGSKVGKNRARVKKVDLPLLLAQRVALIRNNKLSDQNFLYYLIRANSFEEYIERIQTGSSVPHISQKQIEEYPVPFIPVDIQKNISDVLLSLDSKIELNNRINAELEAMAKTLYDYWFVQFDFPDKNGKPYKTSGGKMVWNEELKREIPEGWESIMIENCLLKESSIKKIPTAEILEKGKFPVVDQSTDFIAGFTNDNEAIIKTDEPRIIFGDHTRILKLINFDFARGADGTQVMLSNNKRMPQHLFFNTLLKIDLSNYGYARHYKFLKDISIILPNETVSKIFETTVSPFYKLIRENIFQNQKLTELRDWLLPMLMNGQVKVMGEKETELSMAAEPAATYKKSRT